MTLYREFPGGGGGNPENALHTFTSGPGGVADWEPGGGLLLHSPEQFLLAGTGLLTTAVTLNAEGVAVMAAKEAEYLT